MSIMVNEVFTVIANLTKTRKIRLFRLTYRCVLPKHFLDANNVRFYFFLEKPGLSYNFNFVIEMNLALGPKWHCVTNSVFTSLGNASCYQSNVFYHPVIVALPKRCYCTHVLYVNETWISEMWNMLPQTSLCTSWYSYSQTIVFKTQLIWYKVLIY